MQYFYQFTRSFLILGLLAFALVAGFSGIALADGKPAETKASGEMKGDGDKKAEDDGAKKAEGDGDKKAEGKEKAPASK